MGTTYPAQIDTTVSLPTVVDNQTPIQGITVNRLRDAILAVEAELGVKPSATYGTVRARLDFIQNTIAPPNAVTLGGDLGGTPTSPLVIGLQGRPLANFTPTPGQVIAWNGAVWIPTTISVPSGTPTGPASGDLGGNYPNPTVIRLQMVPVDTTPPNTVGQVLFWNGSVWTPYQLTQDQILPGFAITFAAVAAPLLEVGQVLVHPAFTATYTATPTSASLSDSVPNSPQNVILTPNSFSSTNSYVENSYGQSVTFTLTAGNGIVTRTANTAFTWVTRNYYGVGPAGQSSAAFIQSLSGSFLANARQATFTTPNADSTEKIYYAYRVGFGIATIEDFIVGGFGGGFSATNTSVSVTNMYGYTDTYVIYESDNLGLGSITVTVI